MDLHIVHYFAEQHPQHLNGMQLRRPLG